MILLNRFVLAICQVFDITENEMKSPNRDETLKWARFFFFMYARKHTSLSWKRIADFVNRDHTTAMHGNKRIRELIKIPAYSDLIEKHRILESEICLILEQKEHNIQEEIKKLELKIEMLKNSI